MRRYSEFIPPAPAGVPAGGAAAPRSDWVTLARLLPYLWHYKWRALAALTFMVGAKLANIGVPLLLKRLIDAMNLKPGDVQAVLVVPVALLLAYGLLRLSTSLFTELRELVFVNATEGAARRIALEVFRHLHALSLRFHLERQTGGMSRDIERGVRGVHSLISYSLYSIFPTLIEVTLVLVLLAVKFDVWYAVITIVALAFYIVYTVTVTEWRTQFRREMNELDSLANSRAIDSLLNYETVKYFNNEAFEARRYDENLQRYRRAALKSQRTLSLLNSGQQLIIAVGLVMMMWRATAGVADGRLTLGDLVMVNAFMIQLYIPLGFLGVLYREIKQSLTDLDRMFRLMDREREVADPPGAPALRLAAAAPEVRFDDVSFAYEPGRTILHHVSFTVPAGKTVAVVGPSGAGKSTLSRLLYRFYDVGIPGDPTGPDGAGGRITIAGQDIRAVTQASVRQAIGIVPQDTVLFNDTVEYNIAYGRPGAGRAEVESAARAAHIHAFIASTPKGYDTLVGERGLKLSGGEKQRVAIARTLLKNPPVLIFDEATSALDSANERAIQAELQSVARDRTTLVIAHRLSTVVDAHEILVLEAGRIIERGTHAELLAQGGAYARMWALQQSAETA
ncbi:MAG: efflux ABC transporter+ permease/ATP-binding protein [Burkholderiaceae bacterium]|jgi:ATP-binding cassette subfamily B protein|nr:MAG: efflux ABC transporter+ permease/ATP-binding protein [Burkholderiaceae bacterium]